MPFTTGMIAAREDGGSSLAIPGAAFRLGVKVLLSRAATSSEEASV